MRLPAPTTSSRSVFRGFRVRSLQCVLALLFAAMFPTLSRAQTAPPRPALITQPIEESKLTVLRGNTYPLALAKYDRGAAPASLPMQRMLLVLKRSPELEASLDALLDQQQDKSSPNYHAWLTPEQFGQQFGPADSDIQAITSWLQLQGFQLAKVSNGRTVIEFSGTAAQVQSAFHTEIHKFSVNGADHWANSSDPQIPTALVPAVSGILTLHNFPRHAMNHVVGTFKRTKGTSALTPMGSLFTLPGFSDNLTFYGVGPYDFATIYNVSPLWNATPAINGTGQTIAIVGETDVDFVDLQKFRALFGITSNDPTMIVDGPDPGLQPDEIESDLDLQWSSAVAPGAAIKFVVAATTDTTLGVDLAAQYIVDHNVAPIVSESYGICEAALGTAGNQFFNQLWQQAAAQGMSVFLSSGDSGSAGCDRDNPAEFGLQVSGFASTPYTTAVGGTDFNDLNNFTPFWNLTNDAHEASAKSYIPEMTWNDSCTNAEWSTVTGSTNAETNCNNGRLFGAVVATGGSGGKSSCTTGSGVDIISCTGGYPKPSWQTGTGVPNDGKRDIPDVSLFASNGFNGNFYIICSKNVTGSYCDPNNPNGTVVGIGGTSASTPAFAGIMAMIDQKTNSRQGNANYTLYSLAAKQSASGCNSSSSPASTCVFYDVTLGTIAMPCLTGSTSDCHTSVMSDRFGVLTGYATTAAYDLATGLGTVNATNLVNTWATTVAGSKGSTTTLSMTPTPLTITHGAAANLNVTVAPAQGGTGTPSGEIALETSTGIGVGSFLLANGTVAGTTGDLPGGSYTVTAHYPGDATFAASDSTPIFVKVNPEASKATIAYELFDPNSGQQTNPNATSAVFGASLALLRINVTSLAADACAGNTQGATGCPTGTVTLTDNGNPLDGGTFALNGNGYVEDQLIDLAGGTHNLKVTYPGDNSYSALTPATDVITITPVPIVVALATEFPRGIVGQPIDLVVNFSANGIYSNVGTSGILTVSAGSSTVSSIPINLPVDPNNHSVSTQIHTPTSPLVFGTNTFSIKYSGDPSYVDSNTPTVVIVGVYSTNTVLTSSSPTVQVGQTLTLTAKVSSPQQGGPPLTGTVVFLQGPSQGLLGGPVTVQNGQAQLTTTLSSSGNTSISAAYSGDANYAQSSFSVIEVVNPIESITSVTASNPSFQQGQNATFTATVSPSPAGGPTPTGTVMFLVNGAGTGGGNVTLNASGQAVLSSTTLPVGSVTVTGNYLGDFAHSPSSGTVTVTVTATPDFSIAASPTSITIAGPGQTGSTSLMLSAMNGLTGTFSLVPQCVNLPSESTCAVSPASVTFSSTVTTATVMLMVATRAPSSVTATRRFQPTDSRPGAIFAIGFFGLLSLLGLRRGRRGIQVAFTVITFAALLTFAACGGGSGGGGGGVHDPGTPVGLDPNASVSFTIGTATHSVPISINVQ
jgi:Pro-kumamolisin, activation domain/Bacterial Ig-like domain (group 3)